MKDLEILFWFIWIMSIIFLLVSLSIYEMPYVVPLILLFILIAIAVYSQVSYKKQFRKLAVIVKNINLGPLEEGISRVEKGRGELILRVSDLEKGLNNLDSYKVEQEKKYRDLVRKILEVDNKLNRKYKLLGESVIKLSKEIKKS
jgi:hypothetical protein